MKLLVEIPEKIHEEAVNNRNYIMMGKIEVVWKAIANGQPLPDDCEILTKEAYGDLCLRASMSEQERWRNGT